MKWVYRVYQWLVAAPILLVLTIVTAIVTIIGGLFNSDYWGYYPAKWWSRLWCVLLLVRVEVRHHELIDKTKPYLFVANHQGAFDIFSLSGYLGHNFKWMMRKGLHNIPLVGLACHSAGYIMVDTHSAHGLKHTMDKAKACLARGQSLAVFPEGRRSDDGTLGRFKPGAFKLSHELGVPIVPISIDGSYRVMPRDTFNVTPGKIVITLHEPLPPSEDAAQLAEDARAVIEAAIGQ